jgi:hypothetical protein
VRRNAVGFFTGDYEGLSNVGQVLLAFFSQPNGSDPASVFATRWAVGQNSVRDFGNESLEQSGVEPEDRVPAPL